VWKSTVVIAHANNIIFKRVVDSCTRVLKDYSIQRIMRILILLLLVGCVTVHQAPLEPTTPVLTPEVNTTITTLPTQTIVAFGDSITAGFGVPNTSTYPAQLETLLREQGYNYSVINMGRTSDTTFGALERVPQVIAQHPQIVILQIGANDAVRLYDPAVTQDNIEQIVQQLQAQNITVILAGNPVVRLEEWDFPERFTALYPEIARKYDLIYIDFFLEGVVGEQTMTLQDGIHPNAQGYARIANTTYPYILQAITTA
jgi:acyl-CoA thioesterase I